MHLMGSGAFCQLLRLMGSGAHWTEDFSSQNHSSTTQFYYCLKKFKMMNFSVSGQLESAGVTFICSYMTICFCEQVRLCQAEAHRPKFLSPNGLFIAMALMTGFGARFAPNMISFNTMTVSDADGMDLAAHVDLEPILVALFVSVFCSFLGLYISSFDKMFAKTKEQIVEMFVEDAKKLSFKQIQNISPIKMVFLLSSKSWLHLVVGGAIQGSGAIILRCLFVHAVVVEDSHFDWDGGIIFAAVLVAWFVNIVFYWTMFRLTSLYPEQEWLRILGACMVTGGAILTGHVVTAAVQMENYPDPSNENVKPFLTHSQTTMHSIAMVSSICFAFVLMIIGFCDLRSWLYQTSSQVHKYEVLIAKLKKEHPVTVDTITTYIRKHDSMASRHASDSSQHVSQLSGRVSSLVVSPTLKYFFTGAFLGRNSVSPQRPSRVISSNRLQSDIESCRDDGSEVHSTSNRRPERVSVHPSSPGNTGRGTDRNSDLKGDCGEDNHSSVRTIETTAANSVLTQNAARINPAAESGAQEV